jgi:hypothetical protein
MGVAWNFGGVFLQRLVLSSGFLQLGIALRSGSARCSSASHFAPVLLHLRVVHAVLRSLCRGLCDLGVVHAVLKWRSHSTFLVFRLGSSRLGSSATRGGTARWVYDVFQLEKKLPGYCRPSWSSRSALCGSALQLPSRRFESCRCGRAWLGLRGRALWPRRAVGLPRLQLRALPRSPSWHFSTATLVIRFRCPCAVVLRLGRRAHRRGYRLRRFGTWYRTVRLGGHGSWLHTRPTTALSCTGLIRTILPWYLPTVVPAHV